MALLEDFVDLFRVFLLLDVKRELEGNFPAFSGYLGEHGHIGKPGLYGFRVIIRGEPGEIRAGTGH